MDTSYIYNPKSAPLPTVGDAMYKDSECPGLFLRVTAGGSRSWYLYKNVDGKPMKHKIENAILMNVSEARVEAVKLMRGLREGVHPANQRAKAVLEKLWTVEQLFEKYFTEHVTNDNARPKETLAAFGRYWGPLKQKNPKYLTVNEIQIWINAIAKNAGKDTANRQFTTLRACLRWSVTQQLISLDREPWRGIKPFKTKPRKRYLKLEGEYERLKEVLEQNPGDVADAIWLRLWTSARKRNVLAMRWSEIDKKNQSWTFIAKGNKSVTHSLIEGALEVLERRRFATGQSEFVFPSEAAKSGHLENIDEQWYRLRKLAGVDDLRIHDLRHTLPSWMGQLGTSAFTIQKALQHATLAMTGRYVDLHRKPVTEAMERAHTETLAVKEA